MSERVAGRAAAIAVERRRRAILQLHPRPITPGCAAALNALNAGCNRVCHTPWHDYCAAIAFGPAKGDVSVSRSREIHLFRPTTVALLSKIDRDAKASLQGVPMKPQTKRALSLALGVGFAATAGLAQAAPVTSNFSLAYLVSQSLWQGGPTAGIDEADRTGGSVGLYYDIEANTGTVASSVNGTLRAQYQDQIAAGSAANIAFSFLPGSGSIESRFGAAASTGVFLDISGCLGFVALGGCVGIPYNIDTDIAVIDEGLFLNPVTSFTPSIDVRRSANDADQAAGVGSADLVIGKLGPSMNLDLDQTIFFTPNGLNGMLSYRNLTSGASGSRALSIPTGADVNLALAGLDAGIWEFEVLNLGLANTFRNDIDLELRPAFDYVAGSWPPPGSGPFGFGLIDETFALGFNTIGRVGSFRVAAVADPAPGSNGVPEPGTLLLVGAALAGLAMRRRVRK
jgi:hypothetical protein